MNYPPKSRTNTCKDCGNEYPKSTSFNTYRLCPPCGGKRLDPPGPYSPEGEHDKPVGKGTARTEFREGPRHFPRKAGFAERTVSDVVESRAAGRITPRGGGW